MQERKCRVGLLLAIMMVCPLPIFSQSTVKGFIRSMDSGEPVMFASVSLEGSAYGVMTDIEGLYSLTRIPEG